LNKVQIAVFVSGRGSNLKAIIREIETKKLNVKVIAVVSNNQESGAIHFATDKNIPTFIVNSYKKKRTYSVSTMASMIYDTKKIKGLPVTYVDLNAYLSYLGTDLIVLAGFLKKIPNELIEFFENRIINIHPALLPKYGGKGMYGANVHKAIFEAKEKISGATVHYINEIYDDGKIIEQRTVDISDVKSPNEIAERVLKIEHQLLPDVIGKVAKEIVAEKLNKNPMKAFAELFLD